MQMFTAIRRSTLGISIFAVITAGLIAVTQTLTADQIEQNRREQEAKALYQLVDKASIDNDLLENSFTFMAPELVGHDRPITAYRALQNGQVSTVILPTIAPDGYSGNIDLIVGIHADGSLAGVRVLAHKETPGLGDKIELAKSDWLYSFNGESLGDEGDKSFAVKKDGGRFDQFTGATITPRAVVNAVSRTLQFFAANRAFLLNLDQNEVK